MKEKRYGRTVASRMLALGLIPVLFGVTIAYMAASIPLGIVRLSWQAGLNWYNASDQF